MKTLKKTRQGGATLVEAAVTILILFMFLMAIMEFGRAYNIYQTMTDAAREGARFAVSPCSLVDATGCPYGAGSLPTESDIIAKTQTYLAAANITGATVLVDQRSHAVGGVADTKFTRIQVSRPYQFLLFPYSINIHSNAEMRNETN
ncbi:MAG TPA: TadE family protein [Terriglobales bacterium]|nr:TadE family protein [Terriglobales bacterium]